MYSNIIVKGRRLGIVKNSNIIFKNVSFTINSGNALFIKGSNGSGKSTLLRVLAGFSKASEGCVKSSISINDNLHYFEERDLIKPTLTPIENLIYWSFLLYGSKPMDVSYHRENALHALSFMNLLQFKNTPCKQLSLGQRKRVALARLVLKENKIWILDEPLIGLDQSSIHLVEKMMEIHLDLGGIVFLSSHTNVLLKNVISLHLT